MSDIHHNIDNAYNLDENSNSINDSKIDSNRDSIFMSKKKRPSEVINDINSNKKQKGSLGTPIIKTTTTTTRNDKDIIKSSPYSQTIIIVDNEQDNDKERRKVMTEKNTRRVHTHFQSIPKNIFNCNMGVVCQLAAYLYLDETTIQQYCLYWLGEYNNKTIANHLQFNDIIDGVLQNLPIIEVSGQYGLKYTRDTVASHCLILRFAGSPLHRIPYVHFTSRDGFKNPDRENAPILKGFSYIIQPSNKCFLTTYAPGLHSEFVDDNFLYNTILEEFFEPSFIVLTCYYLAFRDREKLFLHGIFEGKTVHKSIVNYAQLEITQLMTHLIKIKTIPLTKFLDEFEYLFNKNTSTTTIDNDQNQLKGLDTYGCIDANDKNAIVKLKRLYKDILELNILLVEYINDFPTLQKKIEEKWKLKSMYCSKQMAIRTMDILNKLK